jgi:lipoate-protein ligase A
VEWQIIDSGRLLPEVIMAKDERLLHQLSLDSSPILHLYEWEGDCLTYGYFTNPHKYLNVNSLENFQIKMARRPTGGGVIFHLTDFAFSALIPVHHPSFSLNTLENYAFINRLVIQVIVQAFNPSYKPNLLMTEPICSTNESYSFCMAKPTQYDVILNGKKVGGAAQRRTKKGFLHQGSISLALPSLSLLHQVLKDGSKIIEAMQMHTYSLLEGSLNSQQLSHARSDLKQHFIQLLSLYF